MGLRVSHAFALACALASAAGALAEQPPEADGASSATTPQAAAAGLFARHTDSPVSVTHRALLNNHASYDSTRASAAIELRGELVVLGGAWRPSAPLALSVVGGASYLGASEHAGYIGGARYNASIGLKLQPLFQERHGFDAALSVRYVSQGFNLSPAVASDVLLGRRLGDTQLLLNLGYGQSFANGDRFGRLRVASLTRVIDALLLGIDGRASFDLGFEDDTPGEAAYDVTGGPFASYSLAHVALSLGAGPTLLRFTDKAGNAELRDRMLIGYALNVGVGASL